MNFLTKSSTGIKTIVATVVVASALVVPGGAAHASGPNFGVLVGANPNGPGGACGSNQNAAGVYLYSDINYQGRCGYFPVPALGARFDVDAISRSVGNDKASSIRIVNSGGVRMGVKLYLNKKYSGDMGGWASSDPDLRNTYYGDLSVNDNVSSMDVFWMP